jgi:hypothetical protein
MVTIILIALILWIYFSKTRSVDKYEYLDVLSLTEWKPGWQILKDMLAVKGVSVSYGDVYIAMRKLEQEGLVESREIEDDDRKTREFRRTYIQRPRKKKTKLSLSGLPFPWQRPVPQT